MAKTVLIPLPSKDFDPTECAIPWKILNDNGVLVRFATPVGERPQCDLRMLNGIGLGILAPILAADQHGKYAYRELEKNFEFQNPIRWSEISADKFDGLILPGGHALGMKEYLEADLLKNAVSHFFELAKPVGAICHGVVLAARSKINGESVLKGRKTTALLATQELLAWSLTRLWLGNYYRTYPQTVEAEVRMSLNSPTHFQRGPIPFLRDCKERLDRGFVVRDRNYLSARWPGDAHRFGLEFLSMLD
jgi:protease I